MKREPPPPPDPRSAVRPTAALSLVLLLVAGLSGLFASSGATGALLHGIAVALALPVAFLGHLIAWVACGAGTAENRQESTKRVSTPSETSRA